MAYLWCVTFLWAFSFSFIGVYLSASVDAYFAVFTRALLACLVFLPWLKFKQVPLNLAGRLMLIGGFQLGVMYLFLYNSFNYLTVPEVVLFTIFTPIYITLTHDLLKRSFNPWYLATASLAVFGAAVIRFNSLSSDFFIGFLLVQGANLCFAVSQVAYKVLAEKMQKQGLVFRHQDIFGYFYVGALIVALVGMLLFGDLTRLPTTNTQWLILLWLGLVASGLGYFMWNKGATLVSTGALAIMNNVLIPAGILVNFVLWDAQVDWLRLAAGAVIIFVALIINNFWLELNRDA